TYRSPFTKLKVVLHGYTSVAGGAKPARASMLSGIERFDPLGGATQDTSVPVYEIVVPLPDRAFNVQW
ncbi:MAG: hypothetical protein ACO3I4_08295, partial [Candidatus Kapaibacteriota bacterium]